jgi:hypothetical protein
VNLKSCKKAQFFNEATEKCLILNRKSRRYVDSFQNILIYCLFYKESTKDFNLFFLKFYIRYYFHIVMDNG